MKVTSTAEDAMEWHIPDTRGLFHRYSRLEDEASFGLRRALWNSNT
jgi:hypothetical protein